MKPCITPDDGIQSSLSSCVGRPISVLASMTSDLRVGCVIIDDLRSPFGITSKEDANVGDSYEHSVLVLASRLDSSSATLLFEDTLKSVIGFKSPASAKSLAALDFQFESCGKMFVVGADMPHTIALKAPSFSSGTTEFAREQYEPLWEIR